MEKFSIGQRCVTRINQIRALKVKVTGSLKLSALISCVLHNQLSFVFIVFYAPTYEMGGDIDLSLSVRTYVRCELGC